MLTARACAAGGHFRTTFHHWTRKKTIAGIETERLEGLKAKLLAHKDYLSIFIIIIIIQYLILCKSNNVIRDVMDIGCCPSRPCQL